MSIIALEKLNGMLVNVKADTAFAEFQKKNPECIDLTTCDKQPQLVQLVLRVPMFKKNTAVPFYAFIKHSNTLAAVVDVQTGSVKVIDPSVIASETEVHGDFRIKGVTYGLKDTIDGFKRYRPLSIEPRRPRKHLTPLSPEVVNSKEEAEIAE